MATIGLAVFILIPITHTRTILVTQVPTHPHTMFVWSVSQGIASQLARSGSLDLTTSSLRFTGKYDYFWSQTAFLDLNHAYNLHLNSDNVFPALLSTRSYGFSLRCLSSLPRPSGRGRV